MGEEFRRAIEDLVLKSKERLDSSELLSRNGFYEDAISRAYYAIFYAASALLWTKELGSSKHSGIFGSLVFPVVNSKAENTGIPLREQIFSASFASPWRTLRRTNSRVSKLLFLKRLYIFTLKSTKGNTKEPKIFSRQETYQEKQIKIWGM